MCGRLACGLDPKEVINCCCYKNPENNQPQKPVWKDVNNSGKKYSPSFNICPTDLAPVLMSGNHFNLDCRVIVPTIFGLIPSWSKADVTSKYSTINCRIENIKTSKLYWPLLEKGQRCIVICNGFFEWKNEGKHNKKPYFIHAAQPNNVLIDDPSTWNIKDDFQYEKTFKPLKLAALFEKQSQNPEDEIISFTIITKEASSKLSWLHMRMPAFIETDEQLHIWLDNKNFDANQALQCLSHFEKVIWYSVSSAVNFTSNKDLTCIKQKEECNSQKKEKDASVNFLKNWLGKRESKTLEDERCNSKIIKKL